MVGTGKCRGDLAVVVQRHRNRVVARIGVVEVGTQGYRIRGAGLNLQLVAVLVGDHNAGNIGVTLTRADTIALQVVTAAAGFICVTCGAGRVVREPDAHIVVLLGAVLVPVEVLQRQTVGIVSTGVAHVDVEHQLLDMHRVTGALLGGDVEVNQLLVGAVGQRLGDGVLGNGRLGAAYQHGVAGNVFLTVAAVVVGHGQVAAEIVGVGQRVARVKTDRLEVVITVGVAGAVLVYHKADLRLLAGVGARRRTLVVRVDIGLHYHGGILLNGEEAVRLVAHLPHAVGVEVTPAEQIAFVVVEMYIAEVVSRGGGRLETHLLNLEALEHGVKVGTQELHSIGVSHDNARIGRVAVHRKSERTRTADFVLDTRRTGVSAVRVGAGQRDGVAVVVLRGDITGAGNVQRDLLVITVKRCVRGYVNVREYRLHTAGGDGKLDVVEG